ncbi:MAG: Ig-like domain repeat protein [Chloroflexi bacterium]|nr:Ig-like domain repeat protein [Chloroflexota bacterium]
MLDGSSYLRLNRPAQVIQLVLIALMFLLPLIPRYSIVFSPVQTVTAEQGQVSPDNSNPAAVATTNPTPAPVVEEPQQIPAPAQTASQPEELTQSLYLAWMETQNREAATDSTYHLTAAGSGELQGDNPAQGLALSFQASGVTINGMNLALTGIGYQGQALETLATVAPVANANRVEYQRGAGLTEWYANNAQGLEQGFTLTQAWPGANGNELSLELALSGGLFQSAGANLTLVSPEGKVANYGGLYVYDAAGQTLPSRMEVSGEGSTARLLVNVDGAQYPLTIDPLVQTKQLIASDGATNDTFGSSVSLSSDGNTALIGAYFKKIGANSFQGAAYVFTRTGSTWSQQQVLTDTTTGAAFDWFGLSVSLSSDGNTALIGASYKTIGANGRQGAAYVFTRTGSTWSQQQVLTDTTTGAANDYFGWSVSLSSDGNTALIGAYFKTIGANTSQGAAYTFEFRITTLTANPANSSTYGQVVTLTATISPTFASGTVTFTDGTTSYTTTVVSGVAIFTSSTWITGSHTFTATYSGDSSNLGSTSNSLSYTVYSPWIVRFNDDDGSGTVPGSFSYALALTTTSTPLTITFALTPTNIITFSGHLIPSVQAAVEIDGGSVCSSPPAIIINGNGATGDGLVLKGNNLIRNLWVKGFTQRQITISFLAPLWKKNVVQCVKVSR